MTLLNQHKRTEDSFLQSALSNNSIFDPTLYKDSFANIDDSKQTRIDGDCK